MASDLENEIRAAAFGRDGAALSIQTSVESPYADVQDAETGEIAYKYRGTGPNHPDNIALRRAMEMRQPLIYLMKQPLRYRLT